MSTDSVDVSSIFGDGPEPEHQLLGAEAAQRAAIHYIDKMDWAVTAGPGIDINGICWCKIDKSTGETMPNSACRNPGKHAYKGWGNDSRQTLTAEQAERYWSPANQMWRRRPVDQVFIVPYLSGLVVADVDDEIAWFQLDSSDRPETLSQRSGSGRGAHYLYKYEWDVSDDFPPSLPGKIGKGAGEVKFRGIIAAAPSVHAKGGRYMWENWGTKIADAPKLLTEKRSTSYVDGPDWGTIIDAERTDPWISEWFALTYSQAVQAVADAKTSRPLVVFAVSASQAVWVEAGWITPEKLLEDILNACERNGTLDDYGRSEMKRQIKNGIAAGRSEKRT